MNALLRYSPFCALMFFSSLVFAQDREVNSQLRALKSFNKMYPQAQFIDWSKNELGIMMVSFMQGEIYYDAFYAVDGKWVRTENIIEFNDLPEDVFQVFEESEYFLWERGYVYQVDMPRQRTYYKIYVYDANWQELELVYDLRGNSIVLN